MVHQLEMWLHLTVFFLLQVPDPMSLPCHLQDTQRSMHAFPGCHRVGSRDCAKGGTRKDRSSSPAITGQGGKCHKSNSDPRHMLITPFLPLVSSTWTQTANVTGKASCSPLVPWCPWPRLH